jgi:hypothetical protein
MPSTTSLSLRGVFTPLRQIACSIQAGKKARRGRLSLECIDHHVLNDIGVRQLPNGVFVKQEPEFLSAFTPVQPKPP